MMTSIVHSGLRGPIRSAGAFLLEALVALVVFSLGMLGLLALLAGALRASGSAQWRSEGADLAAAAIARMTTEDGATLVTRYDATDGDAYRALLQQAARLPGVSSTTNAPGVDIDDTAERRRVRVDVRWLAPGETTAHRASVSAMLPHR
jgi:type IV pilus assembly protein PilV